MKELMQNVARSVAKELPQGTGFFVLAYDFKTMDSQYVSNSNRDDVILAMKEFIARNEMQNPNLN